MRILGLTLLISVTGFVPKVVLRVSSILKAQDEDIDGPIDSGTFQLWEQQERVAAIDEIRTRAEEDEDRIPGSGLPDYMLRMIEQFEEYDEVVQEAIPAAQLPLIAVIGRPNTGKSTIVNRLSNSFKDGAIVNDEAGVTRDPTYRVGSWDGYNFQVVDTGGIVFEDREDIFADKITQQALLALEVATAAILVCDGQQGVLGLDEELGAWLRKNNKVPLFLAVNKCESETNGMLQAVQFWDLDLETHILLVVSMAQVWANYWRTSLSRQRCLR